MTGVVVRLRVRSTSWSRGTVRYALWQSGKKKTKGERAATSPFLQCAGPAERHGCTHSGHPTHRDCDGSVHLHVLSGG